KQNQEAELLNKTRSLKKSVLDTSANASRTVGFNKNYVCKKPLKKSQDQDKIKKKLDITVSEETHQELPEPKQTEHMLQNSHMEYNNNKTQGTSHELSLGMNLDDKKVEQPKAEIEANGSSPNNKEIEQPKMETEINNNTKSTQFMLPEKTIQKEIALNIQEIWQENGLHNPIASLYNNMSMVKMLTNIKQEDSNGFKLS
ncbi:786_t:CDS:2, partial [Cetraspora pellucida]